MITCPGCHALFPDRNPGPPERFNASGECWQAFCDLSGCTVAKQDEDFIHQHAVDAYEAQHAGGKTRPIAVAFGLIGLYLALERGYTGREVQRAHMRIAKIRRDWPRLPPPAHAAQMTVADVLMAGTDAERDAMILRWAAAVWENWAEQQAWVRQTTDELLGL